VKAEGEKNNPGKEDTIMPIPAALNDTRELATCPRCNGTKREEIAAGTVVIPCRVCKGIGEIPKAQADAIAKEESRINEELQKGRDALKEAMKVDRPSEVPEKHVEKTRKVVKAGRK
jgi:hypothetical protein